LQSVAVCCSALQRGAAWCSVLQCGAVCCSVLQCAVMHASLDAQIHQTCITNLIRERQRDRLCCHARSHTGTTGCVPVCVCLYVHVCGGMCVCVFACVFVCVCARARVCLCMQREVASSLSCMSFSHMSPLISSSFSDNDIVDGKYCAR